MVTAEEQGLLGSQYYAEFPLYPLQKTLANINIDGINQWGRTKDLTLIGLGASDLDDYARAAADEQGRVLRPDAEPEKGFYYRSDHFNFAKKGVPALDPDSGIDFIGKPADYGKKKRDEYTSVDYHAPSDQVKAGLGSQRRGRRRQAVPRRRVPARAGRQVPGVEAGQRIQGHPRQDARKVDGDSEPLRLGELGPAVRPLSRRGVGRAGARRPASLRDAHPRGRAGRPELDHDPSETRRVPKGVRSVRSDGKSRHTTRESGARSSPTPASSATGSRSTRPSATRARSSRCGKSSAASTRTSGVSSAAGRR